MIQSLWLILLIDTCDKVDVIMSVTSVGLLMTLQSHVHELLIHPNGNTPVRALRGLDAAIIKWTGSGEGQSGPPVDDDRSGRIAHDDDELMGLIRGDVTGFTFSFELRKLRTYSHIRLDAKCPANTHTHTQKYRQRSEQPQQPQRDISKSASCLCLASNSPS